MRSSKKAVGSMSIAFQGPHFKVLYASKLESLLYLHLCVVGIRISIRAVQAACHTGRGGYILTHNLEMTFRPVFLPLQ